MPKHNPIPPAILSFVRKSKSLENDDDDGDDDRALLLPSQGSSFNLSGDSERYLTKSSSHQSRSSKSSQHSKAMSSSSKSSGSGSSGSQHHQHRHHGQHRRASSGGGGGTLGHRNRKKRSSPRNHHDHHRSHSDHSQHSTNNNTRRAGGGPIPKTAQQQSTRERVTGNSYWNPTARRPEPIQMSNDASLGVVTDDTTNASSNNDYGGDEYLVGIDSSSNDNNDRGLSPIPSHSFHSEEGNNSTGTTGGNSRGSAAEGGQPTEIDWSTRRPSNNSMDNSKSSCNKSSKQQHSTTNKSEKSIKGNNNNSNSGSNHQPRLRNSKIKRENKRRQYIQRWRRRRLLGSIVLTLIYSLLVAYTCLVTLGPLMLYYWDMLEWCPYYHGDDIVLWEGTSMNDGRISKHQQQQQQHREYTLDIDQLQQSGLKQQLKQQQQQQQEVHYQDVVVDKSDDKEQHGRKLSSNGMEYTTIIDPKQQDDVKKVEIKSLRTPSKDTHSTTTTTTDSEEGGDQEEGESKYDNPDYNGSPCHTRRIPFLFYLTLEECDLSRRMAASVLLGGFIGYERRAADRPAGIRTMALVALGSCFFTISSQLAFRDSPMTWDSSRVAAAIPSGVGFLGAGLIWKGSLSDGSGGEVHQVHGITTAASVWLAAAVGAGAGGALYAVSAYSTALVILVLRFGPRLYLQHDRGFEYDDDDESDDEEESESEDGDRKYGTVPPEQSIPPATIAQESDVSQRNNYEMHQMGGGSQTTNNAASTLNTNNTVRYGSTDVDQNTVAHLLHQDQQRQIERMNQFSNRSHTNDNNKNTGPPFLSWLTRLMPGSKERQQPLNPYQEISRDREVVRMMKKKKSMSRMGSRPSFCT